MAYSRSDLVLRAEAKAFFLNLIETFSVDVGPAKAARLSAATLANALAAHLGLHEKWNVVGGVSFNKVAAMVVGVSEGDGALRFSLPDGAVRYGIGIRLPGQVQRAAGRIAAEANARAGDAPPRAKEYARTRDAFLASREWKILRYDALKKHGAVCLCCGATRASGAQIHVDHIKPMFTHWHLRAVPENLQVLCADCNVGKGARDTTDWRG